jgi:hypothetical protein
MAVGAWAPARANTLGLHASVTQVDCIWAAFPAPLKQSLASAATFDAVTSVLNGWNPTDGDLMNMAKRCGVTQDGVRVAGVTIAGKVFEVWADAQLAASHAYSESELSTGWALVPPASRLAVAQWGAAGAKGPLPDAGQQAPKALIEALHPPSKETAIQLGLYALGRSILETMEADT